LDARALPSSADGDGFLRVRVSTSQWELAGETSLLATALPAQTLPGQSFIARISVCNVYGPIDDCQVCVRASDDADWQAMQLREELIDAEGELRRRAPGETPAGEAPWSATFELECTRAADRRALQIRVQAASAGLDQILTDWTLR
jgi:hypothetical protein